MEERRSCLVAVEGASCLELWMNEAEDVARTDNRLAWGMPCLSLDDGNPRNISLEEYPSPSSLALKRRGRELLAAGMTSSSGCSSS